MESVETREGAGPAPVDTGLNSLVLLARFLGVAADPEQIRHEQAVGARERFTSANLLRAARRLGLKAAESAIAQLQEQRKQLAAETSRATLATVADLEQKVAALRQERVKTVQVAAQQTLTAPVDGVVQQLKVHTVGGVVTPADPLMVIVPNDDAIEIEAMVLNQDIGWVHDHQAAAVKVEAFPFTRYGTLDAEVLDVNDDAISNEQLGLVYAARVTLVQNRLRVEDKWIRLSPGMAVTVEIKTGTRRLVDYFLSPVSAMKDESIRER